jgi:succinate-semialdehyde dehydrogenase / glutarate-semialdehyde dehydrogenase
VKRPELTRPELLETRCFVAGEWCDGDAKIDVHNPATGALIASVPRFGRTEVDIAVTAAEKAMPAWAALTAKARALVLRRWFDLMLANADDLAAIMTAEQGKPISEAKGEILYAASFIEWFAEEGKRVYGDVIPAHDAGMRVVVLKQPIGVTAAITPWNFPAAMITRKAGPALAAGCAMVIKPASATPLTALAICRLAEEAGVPKGILSCITGNATEISDAFCTDMRVRKISFTGSTEIGRQLMANAAQNITKLSLELGGNAPFIVFDDADLDAAVAGAMQSKFRNAGQTCVCANRIYVQAGIHDAFVDKLKAAVEALKVGDGSDRDVNIGPLINMAAVDKIEQHIADAVDKGAAVVAGGKRSGLGGSFFEPTIITGAQRTMLVAEDETFAPLAPIFRFESEEEVIALANDTVFGLASYFYARDLGQVWRVAEALEYGIVGVNTGLISTEVAPFGGVKQSGLGREGSKYGIEDYLEIKYVCMGGINRP